MSWLDKTRIVLDPTAARRALTRITMSREDQFQTIVENALPEAYPDWLYFPFPGVTQIGSARRRPDGVLIHQNLNDYWIVEFELSRHSWTGHVEPQVRDFIDGDRSWLLKHDLFDSETEVVREMIQAHKAKVLVIVDHEAAWPERSYLPACQVLPAIILADNAGKYATLFPEGLMAERSAHFLTEIRRQQPMGWRVQQPLALDRISLSAFGFLPESVLCGVSSDTYSVDVWRTGTGTFLKTPRDCLLDEVASDRLWLHSSADPQEVFSLTVSGSPTRLEPV